LTLSELINSLIQRKPKDTLEFDIANLLIAVNGIDSSALDGLDTKLEDNDVVSIIPVIHGGTASRIQFSIMNSNVEIFDMTITRELDIEFLNKLREKYPYLTIQAINSRFILDVNHIKKILALSLYAKKNKTLLSKKIETDILLRLACTTQISYAIKVAGRKPKNDFVIVAIGKKSTLDKLNSDLISHLNPRPLSKNNHSFMKKQFKISKKQMSVLSSSDPLEDILVEKAAVLF
jgi:tRNA threonylcarbamoyladenosine modification (KEOPS) complex Cgi121 subunit/molybdopterin converting factor small subunit